MNLNANGFSKVSSRPPELDVSYLIAATGGSSAEGSEIMQQVWFGSIQKGVTTFGDICNSYSYDNILQSCLVNLTLAYLNASKIYINIDNLRTCLAAIFHIIEIHIKQFNGQLTYEKFRATGEKEWYMGLQRNNWVWVKMAQQC
jgi:hypothetical protein